MGQDEAIWGQDGALGGQDEAKMEPSGQDEAKMEPSGAKMALCWKRGLAIEHFACFWLHLGLIGVFTRLQKM